MYKIEWALVASFAPELVLWRAFSQIITARTLKKKINFLLQKRAEGIEPDPDPNVDTNADTVHLLIHVDNQREWTLRHGFFALMGGFLVLMDSDQPHLFERPEGYRPDSESILSPGGVLLLGHIPAVEKDILNPRSRTDDLSKVFAICQAGWMLIQTLGRKLSGLPITLLELNTMAHVGCALFMYAIWFKKPQDVREPIGIPLNSSIAEVLFHWPLIEHMFKQAEPPELSNWVLRYNSMFGVEFPNQSGIAVVGKPVKPLRISDTYEWSTRETPDVYEWWTMGELKQYKKRDGVVILLP